MQHPLERFRYCPVCGSEHFEDNNEKSRKCRDCGFTYYINPSAATVAIIENRKGDILVARRAKEPAKGMLDLPGGFVDMYETVEEALAREVMEETNLKIDAYEFLFSIPNTYPYSGLVIHTADLFFRCVVNDMEPLKAQDDVAELFFIDKAKLDPAEFGMKSVAKAIKRITDI